MWLVVGLGNPGGSYERNRHNIGFIAADAVARKLDASPWVKKFGGEWCETRETWNVTRGEGEIVTHHAPRTTIYFLKPQTYMNLSGDSVAAAARFYKIPADHILVLHDELDLPAGKLRIKQGGGDGGHNGIKSIDAHMGEGYWRVRIGIGHPGDKALVSDYVLSDFSREEWKVQETMIEKIANYFPLLLQNDSATFMNKIAEKLGTRPLS